MDARWACVHNNEVKSYPLQWRVAEHENKQYYRVPFVASR